MTFLPDQLADPLRSGGFCILLDDLANETRACLVANAATISADTLNRMLGLGNSLPYVTISAQRAEALHLVSTPPFGERRQTAALASVEAREGVSTGISTSDRALTVRLLARTPIEPTSLVQPGHIFPILVHQGGTLFNAALPEAATDIVRLCCADECALLLDVLGRDGARPSLSQLTLMAEKQDLRLTHLSALIQHRLTTEQLVTRVAEAALPTQRLGQVRIIGFRTSLNDAEHVALVRGTPNAQDITAVRVQVESTWSDLFGGSGSSRSVLEKSMQSMADAPGPAVLVYLRAPPSNAMHGSLPSGRPHEGEQRLTRMRTYGLGAQVLRDLGVRRMLLLGSSQTTLPGLELFGLEVVGRQQLEQPALH